MRAKVAATARAALLVAVLPAVLGVAFVHWPLVASLERSYGLDLLFKLRGTQPAPAGVAVVAIDDASFFERGLDPLEPWPRGLYGELVTRLAEQGAAATAFDVLFETPRDPEQDVAFELGLFEAGNVVLGATVERVTDPRFRQARLIEPHAPFAEAAAAVAEVELPTDHDGVIRETWLVPEERPSLALAGYRLATGDTSFDGAHESRLIDYYGPPRTIPTVSLYQALDPEQYLPEGFFRDRIVFVGASQVAAVSAAEVKDSFPTPFTGGETGLTAGVEIHATIAANLLEGRRVDRPPALGEAALLIGLALAAALTFVWLRPPAGGLALVVLFVGVWVAGSLAFSRLGLWLPVVVPATVQLPVAYGGSLVWYYLTTVREREKIRRAFSFYLSPEMIRKIQESPGELRLGGEEIVGTAVFTDIKGFTSIAESMSATETASMLNDYFSDVTQKLFDSGGTLIKYIGDAVFAIWGAPVRMDDHATRACLAAVAMGGERERSTGPERLVTRVGVHTGPMLVGNLGSSQRFDYTAIGDTVNLAARLESLNKATGTRVLASGETIAGTDGELVTRYLGRARVAGRFVPVALYELLGTRGEATRPDAESIALFEKAVEAFTEGRFAEAKAGFAETRRRCGGADGPSELYLGLLDELGAGPPPADWDGVINFTTK